MLTIRRAQLASADQAAEEDFARRAVAHLGEFFPEKLAQAGEARALEFVRRILLRAREYDIVSEQDVCLFLDVAVVFGWNFDRSCTWARRILTEPGYGTPSTRMELLFEAAMRECGPSSAVAAHKPGTRP